MTLPCVEVHGLGKEYRKNTVPGGWKPGLLKSLWTRGEKKSGGQTKDQKFWALRDISFSIDPGEAIGIIGHNGAGKTTLLKILARITPPTEGEIRLRGQITPLLGVGTGFVKSLSGRDNIFLNASIMGLSRVEIQRSFDEIVDFSGVGDFIDMPVKYYSSGMYSRLAFAVAAHVVRDILLVDEVLSVGDVTFQKKSLNKMTDLMGNGRTVIFVSHNLNSVLKFCRKVLWLNHGQVAMIGEAQEVVTTYLKSVSQLQTSWRAPSSAIRIDSGVHKVSPEKGDRGQPLVEPSAQLLSFEVKGLTDAEKTIFFRNEALSVTMEYQIFSEKVQIVPAIHLVCAPRHGVEVETHVLTSYDWSANFLRPAGVYRSTCHIPCNFLNDGEYRFSATLVTPGPKIFRHDKKDNLLSFKVVENFDPDRTLGSVHRGVIRPDLVWKTELTPVPPRKVNT